MSNQKIQSKMKRLILFVAVAIASLTAFGQKGFTDFDTVADVLVKSKIAHANSKDDSTPLELSLFLQNIGTRNVIVRYEIYIESSNGELRRSGKKEIKIKPAQKQAGKISGLSYTLPGSSIDDYASGENRWYFTMLDVIDAESGEVIARSSKIKDKE